MCICTDDVIDLECDVTLNPGLEKVDQKRMGGTASFRGVNLIRDEFHEAGVG